MNFLKDKTVYLCGSISLNSNSGVEWREEITPKLLEYGLNVLDPCELPTAKARWLPTSVGPSYAKGAEDGPSIGDL